METSTHPPSGLAPWISDRIDLWHTDKKYGPSLAAFLGMSEVLYAAWATKPPKYILGIDEVGLGCLAGPMVIGGVLAPCTWAHPDLRDSKAFSSFRGRGEILARLNKEAPGALYFLHRTSNERIDEIGLRRAQLESFQEIVKQALAVQLDTLIVIDGIIRLSTVEHVALPKADTFVPHVMAASIIAKVSRDTEMIAMEAVYPGYNFIENKGYGADAHYDGLDRLGQCPLHRRSIKLKPGRKRRDTSRSVRKHVPLSEQGQTSTSRSKAPKA